MRGPDGSWKRLGGALALPEHCAFAGRVLLLCDLSPRALVEEVDFVTGFGHSHAGVTRAELGLPGGGPETLISDLAVFDFEGGEMRLAGLYPGVGAEQVEERMGFVPARAPGLAEIEAPSAAELARLAELKLPDLPY